VLGLVVMNFFTAHSLLPKGHPHSPARGGKPGPGGTPLTPVHLYQGRVLKEFLQRVLSRRIVSSNVLVVAGESAGHIVAKVASAEGHSVFSFSAAGRTATNLDGKWWSQLPAASRPGWFLLTFLDPGPARQARVVSGASRFLKEATATYIIVAVHFAGAASARDGLEAVRLLHRRRYKVQLLASGCYLGDAWAPNALLTLETAPLFFKDGLLAAASVAASHTTGTRGTTSTPANAYLFATQGLDLAIPSRREYLGTLASCSQGGAAPQSGRCGSAIQLPATAPKCPDHHARATLHWASTGHGDGSSTLAAVRVGCDGIDVQSSAGQLQSEWISNQTHPDQAECACVRVKCSRDTPASVACITRVLPSPLAPPIKSPPGQQKVNVLTILIDPISRAHFKRSLPRTAALLERLGMVRFNQYAAVGANSGPNQAALFSGYPMSKGRDIATHNSQHTWLWDRLTAQGYKTLKAEDGCVENSNMVQSIKPATSHGRELDELFCFNFDRPT
jgi:hypothetical protein